MARILLVHGSCHGAWCWQDVLPYLAGHEVSAIDLPGHGADQTPVGDITLDLYVDAVLAEIERIGAPVVLVGHSAAGITLASVAERAPEKIARLVYICAYVPQDGDDLVSMRKRAKRQPILPAIRMAEDGASYAADPALAGSIFYHDCPTSAVERALPRLCHEPVLPQRTRVSLGENHTGVARSYILCTDDHTIPPEEQEKMVRGWPESDIIRLDCGHSPFFACPETLGGILDTLAKGST